MHKEKNRPRNIYFLANKPCDKSMQSPERHMPSGRQLSSGEQWGPAEWKARAVTDGNHSRAGSQHIRCVQTTPPLPDIWGFLFLFLS